MSVLSALITGILLQAAQAPPGVVQDRCALEGRVLKSTTGEPLRRVQVYLMRAEGGRGQAYGTTTDESGRFALKEVVPGRYRLSADRNGYLRQEYGQRGPNRPGTILNLEPGQHLKDVTMRLSPFSVIAGRVVDEAGEAAANVRVQALRESHERGRRRLVPAGGATTNDLGEYRIFGLAPGRYYLNAQSMQAWNMAGVIEQAPPGRTSNSEENYVSFYYPGVLDASQAQPIEVGPGGEVRGVDFRLMRGRTVWIRGRIVNSATERPVRSAMVMLAPQDGRPGMPEGRAVVRDAEGSFEIRGVAPGSYKLTANLFEEGKRYSGSIPIQVGDSNLEGVELPIGVGLELPGTLRADGAATFKAEGVLVLLESRQEGVASAASVKPDGSFRLINVLPDQYSPLVRNLPEDYYVKSVRLGSLDVSETGLDLGSAGSGGRLEIVVSPSGGRVEGVVVNEKQQPVPGAIVALAPEFTRRGQTALFKSATADQEGRYSLRGIAPGQYKLFAWEDIEPGAFQDPAFLSQHESHGQSVRIDEGARQSAQLPVIPAPPVR
jgi:protocatechuate 3,4-dioxygenase beta subunit